MVSGGDGAVSSFRDFVELVETATDHRPYPYQVRLAEDGLPEVLDVETGAGKTAAVVLAWLWRRRHPDASARTATPRWLVLCEPMRTLTEQVERDVRRWIGALGLGEEILVHVAMGGREDPGDVWRRQPERDAVVIGTLDMLLSRALNRGYATSRFTWPIDFGLLNNGTHWVFDEVQAMGPALPTSRQLEGLRRHFGTALPTASTWMSATLDLASLQTVDNPDVASTVSLSDDDRRTPGLAARLAAGKSVERVEVSADPRKRAGDIAAALREHHRPGTLSLAVANTVGTARAVYAALGSLAPGVPRTLLHSRFRPADRRHALEVALREVDASGPGRIVVSTQVVEAGVDVSAATLLTEAAPWPSIVQRAGRCNRDGKAEGARFLWVPVAPRASAPYLAEDIEAASAELQALEGQSVTASSMRERHVPAVEVVHPVLRRADLLALFDTAPDLSGNDVDIGPYLRDGEDLDVNVAWRALGTGRPGESGQPAVEELCPVPLGEDLRKWIATARAWRYDHLSEGWVRASARDLRPGLVLIVDEMAGGYDPDTGWDPGRTGQVASLQGAYAFPGLIDSEEPFGGDAVTYASRKWVALAHHLQDVEDAVRGLLGSFDPPGLTAPQREALVVAGRYHDIGKAHQVFQATLLQSADDADRARIEAGQPWAKAAGTPRARHSRRSFRHELASALALLGGGASVLRNVAESDLVVYLVAAHHGRVRLGIRSTPAEQDGFVLGIADGDRLPAVEVPGGEVPAGRLSLEVVRLGRGEDRSPSWTERALALRDRLDVGPFRLGFCEAVVRLADWRASAAGDEPATADRPVADADAGSGAGSLPDAPEERVAP